MPADPRHRRSTSRLRFAAVLAGACAGTCALAIAPQAARAGGDGDRDEPESLPAPTKPVEAGAFLPAALAARNDGATGIVSVMGGWDQARGGRIYDTTAEARVAGPLSLRAGAFYDGPGTTDSPHVELQLDALDQARHGIDLALAAGYMDAGFNAVPAATFKLAAGRRVGAGYLLGNLGYEHGLRDGARAGELRLAAMVPITAAATLGLDSRFQLDLARDRDEPAVEADWEWRSGVVASYAWDRFVFSGSAGVSALRLRGSDITAVGPAVMAGFGRLF